MPTVIFEKEYQRGDETHVVEFEAEVAIDHGNPNPASCAEDYDPPSVDVESLTWALIARYDAEGEDLPIPDAQYELSREEVAAAEEQACEEAAEFDAEFDDDDD